MVAAGRRQLGTRKVGHAGTLDPLASGVLLLLTEEHTRLSNFLTSSHKSYLAWVSFGASTPTLDAEGPLVSGSVPANVELAGLLEEQFGHFLALSEQVPPGYSAVKRGGVKGYEAARKGADLELPARPAGYVSIELLAVADSLAGLPATFAASAPGVYGPAAAGRSFTLPPELAPLPTALIRLTVRAGTYVRAFARDLGERLGSSAFLSGLVRTSSGRVNLEQCVALDRLSEAPGLDPLEALQQQVVRLNESEAARVRQGQRLPAEFEGQAALVDPQGNLAAMAEVRDGRMKLLAVFPGP